MTDLHRDSIFIDGVLISNWSRAIFEEMQGAGYTAVSCTCSVWEGFDGAMRNVAQFKTLIDENSDLVRQVYTTADIAAAKQEGRAGIILSWQNTSGIEDRLEYLRLFRELGVGIMQLTYNTQNLIGSGCWETNDSGLSDFGHDAVAEMNRLGIVIDLSHVGHKTSRDAIAASTKPAIYSHVCPGALRPDRRNRDDEELRFIVDHGGVVGVTPFTWLLAAGSDATIDDFVDAVDYTINICGEDNVGVATDFGQGQPPGFVESLMRDKGYGRLVGGATAMDSYEPAVHPNGISSIAEVPNITAAFEKHGWPEPRIRKVLGENWLALLREVWGA